MIFIFLCILSSVAKGTGYVGERKVKSSGVLAFIVRMVMQNCFGSYKKIRFINPE
ncbi:hypothetical protein BACCELL_03618 [Bacteroides cellulosilyticus DSM 14838]|uniref:Uncharacterized protein n=1 Tax=Bacteroides cellulosilyticus DSM 14838 TaxID=537012 RepID=E2NH44_9BACE|nr:hypothetical protein BACCELL_03618 [Bacteroides cellulosilyticus DSM 14838]